MGDSGIGLAATLTPKHRRRSARPLNRRGTRASVRQYLNALIRSRRHR